MQRINYSWQRFWCPTTGNLNLDYSGFLYNSESEYGSYYNPDVVKFDAISNIPCLILLGEAGIGKTTAIKQEYEKVRNRIQRSQDDCVWFSLGDYDKSKISQAIFGNEKFEAWLNGTYKLHLFGETPAARDIWDLVNSKPLKYKPVDENTFSGYVKRFLDRDLKEKGIIVNREVENRPSQGGAPGERTDIHVDAVIRNSNGEIYDSITVIIEVKGCWHHELGTAMETQLVNRYLQDNTCQHGLYLVAWFNCSQWDSSDYRKNNAPSIGIEEAREQFEQQAKRLSLSKVKVKAFVLNTALR